jgi:hypothetical protein
VGDCAQDYVVVVARHRLQLLFAGEVLYYVQVSVDVLHLAAGEDEAEDRQDLVGVDD